MLPSLCTRFMQHYYGFVAPLPRGCLFGDRRVGTYDCLKALKALAAAAKFPPGSQRPEVEHSSKAVCSGSGRDLNNRLRVDELSDIESAYLLRCRECPRGISCNTPGVEFCKIVIDAGYWQAPPEFYAPSPATLALEGVEVCTAMSGLTCRRRLWTNTSCAYGHEGPECDSCACATTQLLAVSL